MTPEHKLARARIIVVRDAPYISSVLHGLIPVATPGLETMGTTEHMVLMYDPEWIFTVDKPGEDDVLAGILMHECMHVVRKHIERFGGVLTAEEKYLANVAMDIAINPDLIRAGWRLTPKALMPGMYGLPEGRTAEWYFAELKKKQLGVVAGGVCSGCCGGIAANGGRHTEKERQIDLVLGRPEVDQSRIINTAAEAIKKHIQEGARGRFPAGLKQTIERLDAPPRIDWRGTLQHVIGRATGRIKSGGRDFSLRRPSKRSYSRGLLRPGLIQQIPEICIIRDSSYSMGREQLEAAVSETIGIIRATGVDTIWFLDADVEVAFKNRLRLSDLDQLPVHGRGGTNFYAAIQEAERLRPRPDLIVYITDGDGRAPATPPLDIEFVWCVVPSTCNRKPANWGHLVVASEQHIKLRDPL